MMKRSCTLLVLLLLVSIEGDKFANATGTRDGSEEWGYVQVRPKAHMFWWLYRSPYRVEDPSKPWPTVLWLQGGPGASGVGLGNFQEIGPLDLNLNSRNSTWLMKADLLFVDNPVGTGYSFVEDESLFVTTDEEAATDLTTLLKKLYNKDASLQKSPLFIVAESYGGKYAVTLGLSIVSAIEACQLKLKLGGVAVGNSWISPVDFVFSWGPLLLDVSRLDIDDAASSNSLAEKIQQQIQNGQFKDATNTWMQLENLITASSNDVDFYNFLLDSIFDPLGATAAATATATPMATSIGLLNAIALKKYSTYLSSKALTPGGGGPSIDDLMNGPIKEKLKIIPKDLIWGNQSNLVFESLSSDFMKPRINEVDKLLALGVNVTVYNGQLDLICATRGTQAWVQKLKWEGLQYFNNQSRTPLYCEGDGVGATKGFFKSFLNLNFYWILGAGHFVPAEEPSITLKMVGEITQSPAPAFCS